jgi:hypothetical protein
LASYAGENQEYHGCFKFFAKVESFIDVQAFGAYHMLELKCFKLEVHLNDI